MIKVGDWVTFGSCNRKYTVAVDGLPFRTMVASYGQVVAVTPTGRLRVQESRYQTPTVVSAADSRKAVLLTPERVSVLTQGKPGW